MPRYLVFLLILMAAGCTAGSPDEPSTPARSAVLLDGPSDAFGDYWYQGEAELTSYTLEQARYGEVHPGEAVLIFVTEPFSRSRHVKVDRPDDAGDDAVTVLKLNLTKTFVTGVYPYSMMASVFTPVSRDKEPRTLKVTATSQEWCGHAFTQLDRTRRGYDLQLFSYFESEGDQDRALPDVWLEDEVWTTIRLNPADLPTGEVRMLPGSLAQRLSHAEWKAYDAVARLEAAPDAEGMQRYTITYPELERTLVIRFEAAFPYRIEGWEETYRSGFGADAQVLTTRAEKNQRLMLDYWRYNNLDDHGLRGDLGLTDR